MVKAHSRRVKLQKKKKKMMKKKRECVSKSRAPPGLNGSSVCAVCPRGKTDNKKFVVPIATDDSVHAGLWVVLGSPKCRLDS